MLNNEIMKKNKNKIKKLLFYRDPRCDFCVSTLYHNENGTKTIIRRIKTRFSSYQMLDLGFKIQAVILRIIVVFSFHFNGNLSSCENEIYHFDFSFFFLVFSSFLWFILLWIVNQQQSKTFQCYWIQNEEQIVRTLHINQKLFIYELQNEIRPAIEFGPQIFGEFTE